MKTILVLMMAGSGTRFGSEVPKQFHEVNGVAIYKHILNMYANFDEIDEICLVCNSKWIFDISKNIVFCKKPIYLVAGGDTRSESVRNAVIELTKKAIDSDIILIHDATHPYIDKHSIRLAIRKIADKDVRAVTLASHVWDTVYLADDNDAIAETLPREKIAVGASPECFSFDLLKQVYVDRFDDVKKYTSVGNFIEKIGERVEIVWTNKINLKITYKEDFDLFKYGVNYFIKKE